MPDSFVTEHLGRRHTDMLWRIGTTAGGWVYILILLEFQSTVDPRMAAATDIADLLPPGLEQVLGRRPRPSRITPRFLPFWQVQRSRRPHFLPFWLAACSTGGSMNLAADQGPDKIG